MNKKSNALIAALTLTAIVLAVVLLTNTNRQAQGNMLNAQSDFSLMTTGDVGADESLVIIDKEAGKIIVYKLVNGRDLNVMAWYDFGKGMNPGR